MPVYATKRQAADANPAFPAKRCARCRQWHNEADKPSRRKGRRK